MSQRLRVACLDKTPEARSSLQNLVHAVCEEYRSSFGHVQLLLPYPSSREELYLNSAPNIFLVGPRFTVDEAYSLCLELKESYPDIPVLVFLNEASYSLRLLRRFESCTEEIFAETESSLRVLHTLLRFVADEHLQKSGRVIPISGAKGGVGVTSSHLRVGARNSGARQLGSLCRSFATRNFTILYRL